ncbi:MAG: ATP-binding protein [Alphaproteobacteria bacterium]
MLLLMLIFCTPQSYAQAQTTLVIDTINNEIPLSSYSYVTSDEEQLLSPDTLISRHRSHLRGEHVFSDLIHLKASQHSTWIVFTVFNKTPVDDWILGFGGTLDGRMGLIKEINIMNYGTKQSLIYPPADGSNTSPFIGSSIPVRLAPGSESTFIIYLTSDSGLPLVIAPTLKTQTSYMIELVSHDLRTTVAMAVFIFMMTFFIGSYYIGRNKASIALFSYYAIMCALFFILNANLVPSIPINGTSLMFIYITGFTMLLVATKFFVKIDHDYKPMENMALFALFILIFAAAALSGFILGHSPLGISTLCGTLFMASLCTSIIAFFSSNKSRLVTALFSSAILSSGIGAGFLLLPSLSVIPANSNTSFLFWVCLIVQSLLFVAAYVLSNKDREERNEQMRIKKEHDDQSLTKLQKSKDSADHARLLRVIERERELMSELREREVKRTEEMRTAKEIADKANNAKSAFLAVVSHEIRTPMNGIIGMVQLLQQTDMSQKQKDYIQTIKNSGDTMMALLNDILDFEKIEHGGMELEAVTFNLHKLVEDVVTLMSGHAAQKNLNLKEEISEDVPRFVSGDPTRLRQVLLNLVNNGLKFTSEGEVIIRLSSINNNIHFEIEDTGIGISESAVEKLFTPFTQAETSTSRKYGGTGLGLAISNRLIEAMGGEIQVKSEVNKGSTFFFDIILTTKSDDDVQSPSQSVHECRPMNILVVEDNEMNRKVLDGLLSNQGHIMSMASNGMEALDICKRSPDIELILMDIQMSGMDGLETTKAIRNDSNKNIARLPIIALTGNVMIEEIESFFKAGMNGFVPKPVDAQILNKVISNAAKGKFENPLPLDKPAPTQITKDPAEHIKSDLKLDDREDFIDDSMFKSTMKTQDPLLNQLVDLNLDDDNSDIVKSEPKKNYKPIKNEEEMTEIQKFLMAQHSSENNKTETTKNETNDIVEKVTNRTPVIERIHEDEDTADAPHKKDVAAPSSPSAENFNIEDILDLSMLDSLVGSLPAEQFKNLLDGFTTKAEEIIAQSIEAMDAQDLGTLSARAHELKGMAGNFGMKHISGIAADIEKNARTSKKDEAFASCKKLNAAYVSTQAAFEKWLANKF